MTKAQEDKGKAALGAAARAFTKAQQLGFVWTSDEGMFETYQMLDTYRPAAPKNPDQLSLGDHY